jgi:triosephosphate isomerase
MEKDRKLLIAGNWKMNKTVAESLDLVQELVREVNQVKEVDIVVCPPFTALSDVSKKVIESNIRLGAQNMSEHTAGAYTGEIAAEMLKEFLVRYVILGHSERRQYQEESDSLISKKALAAHAASIKPSFAWAKPWNNVNQASPMMLWAAR